ncbi:MAG: alpha-glucosidase/alpha-galactosidase [Pseudomonadota bacterium]
MTKIAFIGAGSTIFAKNILGDALCRSALADAHIALMDIDAGRLAESEMVVSKMAATLGAPARVTTHTERRAALDGADFVVVAFQIGGYDPCTITDFEVPKRFGLRQTIADTLGIGGIMRGLRTVPVLWDVCADMAAVCPDALLLQYVNPMAINTWAIAARFPRIRQVGLCHSVPLTAELLAREADVAEEDLSYTVGGINHMAFFLKLEAEGRDLYPRLQEGYAAGRLPKSPREMPRCANRIRFEMMRRTGYFVTESSEHLAEYVPWFLKGHRPDLVERWEIALDEYPKRCVEQQLDWAARAAVLHQADRLDHTPSNEYASRIMEAVVTGQPTLIYGNVRNDGLIPALPAEAAVEVPCRIDADGVHPVSPGPIPTHLTAIMRTNVGVQELVVEALLTENRERIYHAAMLDPRTAAELDLDQIWALVDQLMAAHGDWLPPWARNGVEAAA